MKTMRQHLNRLERKLSKYPEEKRRFTSGKGSRRPVLELASDIVFEEFSEDINEVQKKYDVIIEWEAHSLFEERIPLMKVTISPEHPFFKEHLEKGRQRLACDCSHEQCGKGNAHRPPLQQEGR